MKSIKKIYSLKLLLLILLIPILCSCGKKHFRKLNTEDETYLSKAGLDLEIVNHTQEVISGLTINNQYRILDIPPKTHIDVGEMKIGFNIEGSMVMSYLDASKKIHTEMLVGYILVHHRVRVDILKKTDDGRLYLKIREDSLFF